MHAIDRLGIFERLRHSIQLLACPAEVQLNLLPSFVRKADELALDFDQWRSVAVSNFRSELTASQLSGLDAIGGSQTAPGDGGKVKLHMTITQSEVDENFVMLVPVFGDFGNGMVRLGQITIGSNATRSLDILVPSQPKKVALNAYKDVLER